MQPSPGSLARAIALATLLTLAATSIATATEFPAGKEGYHSYTEVTAEVAAVAAAHPSIVSRFSIGTTYQGRPIWAVKVSDNVTTDEAEPEVMFDGTHHADEHMATEMTLRILHWLVDGYGTDPRITSIVNTREVWIVFVVNPDGAEFDISGGRFHSWRKNRQPTPGSTSKGTDLNRNYSYHWGGGGRTSKNPQAITYRGPRAFSAPEARAMRDFMASRVIEGRQQIRAAITFHESGRLVMWPYGYTMTNVPSDMTTQDHTAFVKIGKHMAARNGYKPEQASDLYISSGTSRDYQYGVYRIFAFTFEMSVVAYPDDSKIASETGRNKEAVLYLMERAWCPLGAVSAAVRTARCGAFDDDLEVYRGWKVNPDGTDTAPVGARFARANPASTSSHGPKQRGTTRSGARAFVTGARAGVHIERQRSRWPDDHPLAADRSAGDARTAAHVRLRLRPQQGVPIVRHASGDRRASRRDPGRGLASGRAPRRRGRRLEDGVGRARCLHRADDPPPFRGRRRRPRQPRRGRARRHPGHASRLIPRRSVTVTSRVAPIVSA